MGIGDYEYEDSRPGTLLIQIDELVIADFALPEETILKLSKAELYEPGE